jgi:hypothetical protein
MWYPWSIGLPPFDAVVSFPVLSYNLISLKSAKLTTLHDARRDSLILAMLKP